MYCLPIIAAPATTIVGVIQACCLIDVCLIILMHDDAVRNKHPVCAF
jgi:hypothetical protein